MRELAATRGTLLRLPLRGPHEAAHWLPLNETEKSAQFMKLSHSLGVHCPKIALGYFPHGSALVRGGKAMKNIVPGEEVCVISVRALVSDYSVGNSTLHELHREFGAKRARSVLAIFLMREAARTTSPYMPYIKGQLEQHTVETLPSMWSASSPQFQALGPYAQHLAQTARQEVQNQYAAFFPSSFGRFVLPLSEGVCGARACPIRRLSEVYSLENFRRWYAIVRARDWILPMYDAKTSRNFLIPAMDLLNYGQVGIRLAFVPHRHALIARATKAIPAGKEMLFYCEYF